MLRTALAAAALACTLTFAADAATPIEAFGQLPAIDSVEISDDGQSLAYIRGSEGKRYVVVQTVGGDLIAMTDVGLAKVRSVDWGDADHVLITTSVAGAIDNRDFVAIKGERYIIYSFNIRTKKTARLMDRSTEEALNAALSDVVPGTYKGKSVGYLMGYTIGGEGRRDIYRVDLDTGVGVIHQMGSDEFHDFVISQNGQVAARTFESSAGRWRMEVAAPGKPWVPAGTLATGTIDGTSLHGFGRTLDTVLTYAKGENNDDWNLVEIDRATGKAGEIVNPDHRTGNLIHAQDGRLVGISYTDTYPVYEFYDPKLTAAWALVSQAFDGKAVRLSSWSADFGKLVINVEGTGDAGSWYVIDPAAKSAKRIGATYPGITPTDVAEVRLVRYKAADGLALTGYLTLPSGKDPKKLPLVVLPHGGPQRNDPVGFDWWSQALASRGYAVFQPQFRGSSGFGNDFVEAGHGQIGRKMQTDISDGVKVLARTGMIDPKRACIAGASYGGYAALAGVTIEQGLYRCAVAVAPVSDWGRMMTSEAISTGGSKGVTVSYWKRFTGATSAADPMLDTISPARQASKADAPILMVHGRDDTVVPFEQTDVMIKALKAAGKPVDLVTLAAEDHWLSREPTRIQMLKATIEFIEKHNPPN
ncbi:alpha/beta hydrolase family protein [Caulobacter sp.]|uniref:alpha/beta hydrolase family protein n=1 Tax=Caulobacter sp. TaxID=78 RepID=UPI003BAF184F